MGLNKDGSGVRMSMSATGAQAHSRRRAVQQGKPTSNGSDDERQASRYHDGYQSPSTQPESTQTKSKAKEESSPPPKDSLPSLWPFFLLFLFGFIRS